VFQKNSLEKFNCICRLILSNVKAFSLFLFSESHLSTHSLSLFDCPSGCYGLLLWGPSGSGKTFTLKALQQQIRSSEEKEMKDEEKTQIIYVSSSQLLFSLISGELLRLCCCCVCVPLNCLFDFRIGHSRNHFFFRKHSLLVFLGENRCSKPRCFQMSSDL
jgi:Cdc6-like AAA superfamily ATPase